MGKLKLGDTFTSKWGYGEYKVVCYRNAFDVDVQFTESGWVSNVESGSVRKGEVKDYLEPRVQGVGYNSLGKRIPKGNIKILKAKEKWFDMLERCYSSASIVSYPTYVGCSVDREWYDFANFWRWFDTVCDSEDKLKFHLDKDFIFKGNKVYSAETCFLVPRKINNIIFPNYVGKEVGIPSGVSFNKVCGKYRAYSNDIKGRRVCLKYHDTVEQAFLAYKAYKEPVIKEVAEIYKDVISTDLYKILINYEVTFEDCTQDGDV